jgi:hypothetical protein
MSLRDTHLLELSDLSMAEAAILLAKSRAALYQGVGQDKHYLSSPEALVILQHLKSIDSTRVSYVHDFIESNFEQSEKTIVLAEYVDLEQISNLSEKSSEIMVLINGSMVHLDKKSIVMQYLESLSNNDSVALYIVAPAEWIFEYISKEAQLKENTEFHAIGDVRYLPCCVVTASSRGIRLFVFGKSGVEEMVNEDANEIWKRYRPQFSDNTHKTKIA